MSLVMKIIPIFAKNLYSFRYPDKKQDELTRLMEQWNDVSYLFDFLNENKQDLPKDVPIPALIGKIIENANEIDSTITEMIESGRNLNHFFRPLHNQEYKIIHLSKQKGRKNYLRLYAIKVDENCYIITGGAIKFHRLMKERTHTNIELIKMEKCHSFLQNNGIFDTDSYYEFINEA